MAEENGKAVGAEVIKEAVCISADAKDHIKLAQHYIDMGFDHLIFHQARIKAGSWKRTATRCCPDCEMREDPNRTMPRFETVTARPRFYRRAQPVD